MRYSLKTMQDYVQKGWAIDATMGGLVMGRSHDEGGVFIWVKRGNDYVLEAEVEGFEYILNLGATHFFREYSKVFHQPEKHKSLGNIQYSPPAHIRILDTTHSVEPKYLLFDTGGFSVINKYSTFGYLETLDKMNRAVTFKDIGNNHADLLFHSKEAIEIKFFNEIQGYAKISRD